jgi:hypothetical protein
MGKFEKQENILSLIVLSLFVKEGGPLAVGDFDLQ